MKIDLLRIYSLFDSLDNYHIRGEDSITSTFIVGHDASESGYSFIKVTTNLKDSKVEMRYPLTEEKKSLSSTAREAVALLHFLQVKGRSLSGHKIQTYSDSRVLESALTKGAKSCTLQDIMLSIHDELERNNIVLKTTWMPRTSPIISKVDGISRFSVTEEEEFDRDSWGFSDADIETFLEFFNRKRLLNGTP